MTLLMRSILLLSLTGLTSCATIDKMKQAELDGMPGYRFAMLQPAEGADLAYGDQALKFNFGLDGSIMVTGWTRYKGYQGLDLTIQNLTDEMVTVDWNKVSFEDPQGSAGNPVMHKNVKFNDCAGPKTPTVIPPKGRITDTIIPCYGVRMNQSSSGWDVSALPPAKRGQDVTFGVFLPLQVGNKATNYAFKFKASAE